MFMIYIVSSRCRMLYSHVMYTIVLYSSYNTYRFLNWLWQKGRDREAARADPSGRSESRLWGRWVVQEGGPAVGKMGQEQLFFVHFSLFCIDYVLCIVCVYIYIHIPCMMTTYMYVYIYIIIYIYIICIDYIFMLVEQ